jgi:hypothetical protein
LSDIDKRDSRTTRGSPVLVASLLVCAIKHETSRFRAQTIHRCGRCNVKCPVIFVSPSEVRRLFGISIVLRWWPCASHTQIPLEPVTDKFPFVSTLMPSGTPSCCLPGDVARNSVESYRLSTVIGYATFTSSATAFFATAFAIEVISPGISR